MARPSTTPLSTGPIARSPTLASAANRTIGRAERCSAAPARSMRWSGFAATAGISTIGPPMEIPVGAIPIACLSSSPSKTIRPARISGAAKWGGSISLTFPNRLLYPLASRFIEAGRQAGIAFNADFNGAAQEGVGVYQINVKNGWRMSAAKAFLRPAMKRPNVRVFSSAHACRILFDSQRASGVEIDRNGRRDVIAARREVILAAGAVNSPQLLQLSGIGPAAHLRALQIEVRRDSPAGIPHLQDYVLASIRYTYRSRVKTLNRRAAPLVGQTRGRPRLPAARTRSRSASASTRAAASF